MKRRIFFFLLLVTCLPIFSQNYDGVYKRKHYSDKIVISGNRLYLLTKVSDRCPLLWFETDTLANCTFEKVDKNVLLLNSDDSKLYDTWYVEQSKEDRSDDSIRVNFIFSYDWGDLEIHAYVSGYSNAFHNKNGEKTLMIPKCDKYGYPIKEFGFSIRPTEYIAIHSLGNSYARQYFDSLLLNSLKDLKIEEGTNRIDLNIPAIDDWFFARYHVIDEFAYIKGNKIHWHGKVYEKE